MSQPIVEERPLTAAEFYDLCSGENLELVDGRVVEMPPAGPIHGRVDTKFVLGLGAFVDQHGLGQVFLNTGFILRRSPDLVRAPDQAFVSAARLAEHPLPETGFWEMVPDLVVEIVSPNDRAEEVAPKVTEYLECGVPLVWVLYPRQKQVHVHRSGGVRILFADGTLDGEEVVPGFVYPLARLWG